MLANKSEEKGERRRRTIPQASRSLLHNQEKNTYTCMEKLVRRSPVSAITTKHPKSFETSMCTTGQ
jgi:hypothetical protein